MINYSKIQDNIKGLSKNLISDNFIYSFLKAYNFPDATIARLQESNKGKLSGDQEVLVKKKLYYRQTRKTNLYSEFDNLKKEGLYKFRVRFIFLCNLDYVLVFDTVTEETLSSSIDELYVHFDFFFPLIGLKKSNHQPYKSVDIKAAEKCAKLYNQLSIDNEIKSESKIYCLNSLMTRLLYCFFANSVGIFEVGTFHNLISTFSRNGGVDLKKLLEDVFLAISTKERNNLPDFLNKLPFVECDLFRERIELPSFSKKSRNLLLDSSELDWSLVNPDILGSMIQSIVSIEDSIGLSNHFTSVPNIMKVIGPLFLDQLYETFDNVKEDRSGLTELLQRVSQIKIFDPACGSGNFLIVIYKELRLLELRILKSIYAISKEELGVTARVKLSQFYGIEGNHFACEVTKLGLWIAEYQANVKFNEDSGFSYPLQQYANLDNIVRGNATRIDWNIVCLNDNSEIYVVGNPPYKGARKQHPQQKSDVSFVFRNYSNTKNLDYASCWFYLACDYIKDSPASFALVSTNSITQGEQVGLLWPILYSKKVHIFFAHTSFKWKNTGKGNTGVTVVIIGMQSNHLSTRRVIYGQTYSNEVSSINPYLKAVDEIIVEKRGTPVSKLPLMPKGNMPYDGGNLILSGEEKSALLKKHPESAIFIKRLMGSDEFINDIERWCLWICDNNLDQALAIPPIKERIDIVRKFRSEKSDSAANRLADRPHQFRETNSTTTNSIIIPSVSSERREYIPIGFVDSSVIITNLAFAIYDCDPWVFGVITSRMHMVWIRTVCGSLETRLRYSSSLGYNTFPFPDISQGQKQSIKSCVLDILEEREKVSEKSMAQKYDPDYMSNGLRNAHSILDSAVESCYRKEPFVSDHQRLEFLFNEYANL